MRDNTIEFLRLVNDRDETAPVSCRWIGKLGLPALQRGSSLISMNCRTDAIRNRDPGMAIFQNNGQSAPEPSGTRKHVFAPVHCDPDKAIVQFRMYLQGGGMAPNVGHVSLFAFVAHRGELLRIIEANQSGLGSASSSEVATVAWDTWGPRSTRWSGTDETDTAWMAGVAGQRQIYITGDRPRRIHVRDYNTVAVRRELLNVERQGHQGRRRVVNGEQITAHQGCFASNVRSALPFVEVESAQTSDYDGVLMDENHVIGLTVNS